MFHVATSTLTHLLASYGYLAVLLLVAIESTGILFPGETMLLVAAIAAGTTHQLSIALVIVAAASGAILGDNLGFWVRREGGYRRLALLQPLYPPGGAPAETGAVSLPQARGQSGLRTARFVAVLRAWAAFLAGTNRMRWPRFLLFNAAGGIVWATHDARGGLSAR
jgi:membrane protein DedA with SNARE-associated domain